MICGWLEDPMAALSLALLLLLLPTGVAIVAEPGTGPHVNSRRFALPALILPDAGELNRSAAVGECIGSERSNYN